MARDESFAAQLLRNSARGYAAVATESLRETHPELLESPDAAFSWRAHFGQRLAELQTATSLGRAALFVERVRWARRTYRARGVEEGVLEEVLGVLRTTLVAELPPIAREEVLVPLDAALQDFSNPLEADASALDPERPRDRLALRYLLNVLEGRPREAIAELLAARTQDNLGLDECVVDVLIPALREVGRLWHLGDSDISEEHVLTATTKRALAVLAHVYPADAANGKVLLTSAVADDDHDVGGQALVVLMENRGWRCIDLGGDVPPADLVSACVSFQPTAVVLSATLASHLPALADSIRAIRAEGGTALRLYVGGSAIGEAPDLAREWGADGVVGSLREAVDALERA